MSATQAREVSYYLEQFGAELRCDRTGHEGSGQVSNHHNKKTSVKQLISVVETSTILRILLALINSSKKISI